MISRIICWLSFVRVLRIGLALAVAFQAFNEKQYYLLVITVLLLWQGLFKTDCNSCSGSCSANKYSRK